MNLKRFIKIGAIGLLCIFVVIQFIFLSLSLKFPFPSIQKVTPNSEIQVVKSRTPNSEIHVVTSRTPNSEIQVVTSRTPNPNTQVVTKWMLTLWAFVTSDNRTIFQSQERTDMLLLMRKLQIFSVREVNLRLIGSPCSTWWTNPLSMTTFEEQVIREREIEYKLTFEVHPGSIPFQSVVRRRRNFPNTTHRYVSDDLFFVNAQRLDGSRTNCTNEMIPLEIASVCFCPEEKLNAEQVTATARASWAEKDPELVTWPPNVTVSVPDYVQFFNMTLYSKSPKTTEFCEPTVKLLVFISSAPTHFEQRNNIRKTFGNSTFLEANAAKLVFLFGLVKDDALQAKLDQESLENNDIVQANFVDSYHNLSLSHLSMYNWVVTHCKGQGSPMPKWMLKADDDYFLNIPLARRITEANPEEDMIGVAYCATKAIRNVASMTKYYVSRYMYAPDYYVGYLSGVAYLVRTEVLEPIIWASLTTPIIHMDDAYVMGLLAREAGVVPKGSQLVTYVMATSTCSIVNMMSSYVHSNLTLDYMWTQFQNSSNEQCNFDEMKLKVRALTEFDRNVCLYNVS